MNLKQAFLAGPGPENRRQAVMLWLKGLAMGTADIIPGVSGGTVAFITGIYAQLLAGIKSFDLAAVKAILRLDFASAVSGVHLKFLVPLFFGIAVAVVSTSRLMNYLLAHHPVPLWSLFFGLIAASILVVWRKVKVKNAAALGSLVVGTLLGWLIVGLIPVRTPEALWFIFVSGLIAICAMILPGISGAFILLILGKYEYVTGALKNPFALDNMLIIAVFLAGAAVGIASFSRLLHWLFSRWHDLTVACLTGFMLGAMRKIWPWKEVLESKVIRGKVHVLAEQNILPQAFDGVFWLAVALAAAGFLAVLMLESLTKSPDNEQTWN